MGFCGKKPLLEILWWGPGLFSIFVTDLKEGCVCQVATFAEGTKTGCVVKSLREKEYLQKDLDKCRERLLCFCSSQTQDPILLTKVHVYNVKLIAAQSDLLV